MDWAEIEFDEDDDDTNDTVGEFSDSEDETGDATNEESNYADVDSDASYVCDNCGEEIVIPIDMAAGQEQSYVEDCPVCCCPSLIHVYVDDDRVDVRAEPEQDRY